MQSAENRRQKVIRSRVQRRHLVLGRPQEHMVGIPHGVQRHGHAGLLQRLFEEDTLSVGHDMVVCYQARSAFRVLFLHLFGGGVPRAATTGCMETKGVDEREGVSE